MFADDLVKQSAKEVAFMVLTKLNENLLSSGDALYINEFFLDFSGVSFK